MGCSLEKKTILILSEQGIGDNIQFARYIFWLKEKFDCRIIFYINKKISHLFDSCPCEIETDINNISRIDFFQHLLSLQYIYFQETNSFKKCIPFIQNNKENVLNWKNRFKNFKKPIIAIQWKGNENFLDNQERSIPLRFLEKLIKNEDYSFISLQKDDNSTEISLNKFQKYITDFSEQIDLGNKSFEDTIAILKNIDLLISVDTSMTHLASTMEVDTFLLLNSNPDWRWHIQIKNNCLYNKLKIIRAPKTNYWNNISLSILEELNTKFKKF